jgi:hypothetical protein
MQVRSSYCLFHRIEHNDKNRILNRYYISGIHYFKVLLLHKNDVTYDVREMVM